MVERDGGDDDAAGDDLLNPVGSPFCEQPIWMTVMMAAPMSVPVTVPRPPEGCRRR